MQSSRVLLRQVSGNPTNRDLAAWESNFPVADHAKQSKGPRFK